MFKLIISTKFRSWTRALRPG